MAHRPTFQEIVQAMRKSMGLPEGYSIREHWGPHMGLDVFHLERQIGVAYPSGFGLEEGRASAIESLAIDAWAVVREHQRLLQLDTRVHKAVAAARALRFRTRLAPLHARRAMVSPF